MFAVCWRAVRSASRVCFPLEWQQSQPLQLGALIAGSWRQRARLSGPVSRLLSDASRLKASRVQPVARSLQAMVTTDQDGVSAEQVSFAIPLK